MTLLRARVHLREIAPEVAGAPRDERDRVVFFRRQRERDERLHRDVEAADRFPPRRRPLLGREKTPALFALPPRGEEGLRRALDVVEDAHRLRVEDARAEDRAPRVFHEPIDAQGRDADAEEIGRDALDLMRLVEDDRVVRRNRAAVAAHLSGLQREVGEEQVMIHDDDARALRFAPHPRDVAFVVVLAGCTDSSLRARVHVAPCERVLVQDRELGAVAGLRLERPLLDRDELGRHGLAAPHALGKSTLAEVIR